MDFDVFIHTLRDHYVSQFEQFIHDMLDDPEPGASEVALKLPHHSPLFGPYYRVDYMRYSEPPQGNVFQASTQLDFAPVEASGRGMDITIKGFQWDRAVIVPKGMPITEDDLGGWFERWFDPHDALRGPSTGQIRGAIHALTIAADGSLAVDFGTASADAFFDLLEIADEAGVDEIELVDPATSENAEGRESDAPPNLADADFDPFTLSASILPFPSGGSDEEET